MSVRQDTDTVYASTADVARHFRGNDTLADEDFLPEDQANPDELSQADVEKFIEKWSARLDRRTGQSWRPNQVIDETHDHETLYYWLSGHPITLTKRNIITPLDHSKGDKLEVWTGNKWEEWVSKDTRTEGRDGDYWVDNAIGVVFIYERAILRPHPKFRVSYRYGGEAADDGTAEYVPADIRDAVAGAAAADLIQTDAYGTLVPGNQGENTDLNRTAEQLKEEFDRVVQDYKKVRAIWD